jgi:hypothetical protein
VDSHLVGNLAKKTIVRIVADWTIHYYRCHAWSAAIGSEQELALIVRQQAIRKTDVVSLLIVRHTLTYSKRSVLGDLKCKFGFIDTLRQTMP